MQNLIGQLHSEHTELEHALAGIRPRLFRTGEGHQRLNRVHELFRRHIARERKQLYPAIESAAREDPRLADRLRGLGDDLHIVSELAEGFFTKYSHGNPGLIEFATDHGALLTILRIRLRREEEQVFPLYAEIIKN